MSMYLVKVYNPNTQVIYHEGMVPAETEQEAIEQVEEDCARDSDVDRMIVEIVRQNHCKNIGVKIIKHHLDNNCPMYWKGGP